MVGSEATNAPGDGGEFWLAGSEGSLLRILVNSTPGLQFVVRQFRRTKARARDSETG